MTAKILLFDIETSNLNADFGVILCACCKELGKDRISTTILDKIGDDRKVLRELRSALSSADVWVTWYGRRFDVPFIQSRLIRYGMAPLPPIPHVDGWEIARKQMHLHYNRLKSVAPFVLGRSRKTELDGTLWIKAAACNRSALRAVVDHCKRDVLDLEDVYVKIRPLSTAHPNLALIGVDSLSSCPVCGGGPLQKRGQSIKRACIVQRCQCQKCGAWSHGKPVSIKVEAR